MVLGSLIMIPSHLVLGVAQLPPAIPMIALGAAFVLVPAAMWPSVPLVVEKERVGTAFGLMTAIQNIGLFAFPYANGWLRDRTDGFAASQVMFASLGLVGLVAAVLLLRVRIDLPPGRYQLRVLKKLMHSIEAAIEDPEEDVG